MASSSLYNLGAIDPSNSNVNIILVFPSDKFSSHFVNINTRCYGDSLLWTLNSVSTNLLNILFVLEKPREAKLSIHFKWFFSPWLFTIFTWHHLYNTYFSISWLTITLMGTHCLRSFSLQLLPDSSIRSWYTMVLRALTKSRKNLNFVCDYLVGKGNKKVISEFLSICLNFWVINWLLSRNSEWQHLT